MTVSTLPCQSISSHEKQAIQLAAVSDGGAPLHFGSPSDCPAGARYLTDVSTVNYSSDDGRLNTFLSLCKELDSSNPVADSLAIVVDGQPLALHFRPPLLFHGTRRQKAEGILSNGFHVDRPAYVTPSCSFALCFGGQNGSVVLSYVCLGNVVMAEDDIQPERAFCGPAQCDSAVFFVDGISSYAVRSAARILPVRALHFKLQQ